MSQPHAQLQPQTQFQPQAQSPQLHGNGKLASWFAIVGFILMMALDVSLG